ncbi:phospholipase A [uncultured Paraglaciecola sp.]|uniref:phospholipase A n=1 Tax=uncultured Paraglaciecola sp. TaxID=1765024 RepID=UPI0030D9D9CC|tara:strand:- start:66142 stop:67131 length:990 start_codon:yes stop_codon:yes gene_type:complete
MKAVVLMLVIGFSITDVKGAESQLDEHADNDKCLLSALKRANSEQTVAELQKICTDKVPTLFKRRVELEKQASKNRFAIIPHKPNYVLPASVTSINQEPYMDTAVASELDDVEIKFQVSLKYLFTQDLIFKDLDVQFAFTTTSWWQAYNSEISAPFRETNYEPEVIFNYHHSWNLLGLPVEQTSLSFNHQSNGQTGQLSRSWNRIILGFTFAATDNVLWGFRTWYRLPETEKISDIDPSGDDNPDIEKYMGYGELGGLWSISDKHSLEFMFRNNLRSQNKGTIQLGWSFPINDRIQGYVEYFNGYGESLIYYNQHTQRLGIGFKLTNWL